MTKSTSSPSLQNKTSNPKNQKRKKKSDFLCIAWALKSYVGMFLGSTITGFCWGDPSSIFGWWCWWVFFDWILLQRLDPIYPIQQSDWRQRGRWKTNMLPRKYCTRENSQKKPVAGGFVMEKCHSWRCLLQIVATKMCRVFMLPKFSSSKVCNVTLMISSNQLLKKWSHQKPHVGSCWAKKWKRQGGKVTVWTQRPSKKWVVKRWQHRDPV